MAVIELTIQKDIQDLLDNLKKQEDAILISSDFSKGLSEIIANAIRSGTVVITAVPVVVTVGGAPGTGTATGTATIT